MPDDLDHNPGIVATREHNVKRSRLDFHGSRRFDLPAKGFAAADAAGRRMLATPRQITTYNPANGCELATYPIHESGEIHHLLDRARDAQTAWATVPFSHRATAMRAAASLLRTRKTALGLLATREMGKPITDAEAEVEKCAWVCEYYAEHAETFLRDEPTPSSATESFVAFRPLGLVLAVMPWNFPYWQVFRFAAPALMAGNGGILKHASNVSGCALAIEQIFADAGFPEGLFATVIVPGAEASALIADPHIAAVTLTGSEPAGRAVAAAAGAALKKTVLELGGSDAFIVLADADVTNAAAMAARARFQNAGQSCICAKRFIVEDAVHDAFVEAFLQATRSFVPGNPELRETTMGPLARRDLRDDLVRQIAESTAAGAKIVAGGTLPPGDGAYFPPTVLVDVTAEMAVFREETFGPVAAIVRARDVEHAIALANDSPFGLGGAVWTKDPNYGKELAMSIESGAVFINGMTASDPRLPFGGIKASGYGRELSSYGIREFMNIQTVWIGPAR